MRHLVWIAPVLLPLALLIGLAWRPLRTLVLWLTPWAAVPALAVALAAEPGFIDLPWLVLGARVGLDPAGRLLLGASAAVWLAAGLAVDTRRADSVRFMAFYLATMSGSLGLAVALDATSFQLSYALMGFAAYGLVAHDRTGPALRAARFYLGAVVVGEVMIFAGAVLLYPVARSTVFGDLIAAYFHAPAGGTAFLLLLGGFAIKSAVLPLHGWLPPGYVAAPSAGTAVLGGAMINAGFLGWLRFLPLGEASGPAVGLTLVGIGVVGALYGTAIGLLQRDPKAVLAYSSVSQMGMLTIGLGTAILVPQAWPLVGPALLLYAVHHGLSKGALFLGLPVLSAGGPGRIRWAAAAGFLLPALALAGAPGTTGALAKDALKRATHVLPEAWSGLVGFILPVAAVGTTLLMGRALVLAWPRPGLAAAAVPVRWWSGLALAGVLAAGPWWLPWSVGWAAPLPGVSSIVAAAWPVILGGLVAWAGVRSRHRGAPGQRPVVPPGDLWVGIERALKRLIGRNGQAEAAPTRAP